MRVEVDEALCVGTRMCVAVAPEVFEFDQGTGLSHAIVAITAMSDEVVEAGESCPVGAIRFTDADTGEEIATG